MSNFQLYNGENKLHFDEMMTIYTLVEVSSIGNGIGIVIVNMLALCVVDCRFEPSSCQTKDL
jgi:hypothetical protein